MRAAIYGAGAMGTVLGAFIARSGKQIDLITRNVDHVRALNSKGAHIVGSVDFVQKVTAFTPEQMRGKYDIIFLMTKQRENEEICSFLKEYISESGVVCTMQNGLPESSVARVLGNEKTIGCAISWGATFVESGVVALTSEKSALTFSIGAVNSANIKTEEVKSFLSCMGMVTVEKNFFGARWAKLAINSAFSSVSAITGMTFGEIARNKKTKRIALELLNEAFATADKCGVAIEKIQGHDIVKLFSYGGKIKRAFALAVLPLAMKKHSNLVSGMYFDLKNGRNCDIDFINGAVVLSGKRFGVKTPLNIKIISVAHAIEKGGITVSKENIEKLL